MTVMSLRPGMVFLLSLPARDLWRRSRMPWRSRMWIVDGADLWRAARRGGCVVMGQSPTYRSPERSMTVSRRSGTIRVSALTAAPSPGILANTPCGPRSIRPVRTS